MTQSVATHYPSGHGEIQQNCEIHSCATRSLERTEEAISSQEWRRPLACILENGAE